MYTKGTIYPTKMKIGIHLNPKLSQAFWYPHLLPRGGGSAGPPTILKTVASMNLKFCTVLETSFNVLEMLKLLT